MKDKYKNVSSTIGVEFAYKVATLKNKIKVKAQIWDTCNKFENNKMLCSWVREI